MWSRLSQMSWDELRTRVRQEAGKRFDAALYQAGMRPGARALDGSGACAGRFFFAPKELPERIGLLQEHLLIEMEAIVQEANLICRHRFRLLGYTDLDYGNDIDWHLDAVHGKRTPLIPWYKINFLDFTSAGDHKVTWELNRHQHLLTLAKAWLLTHKEKYAQEAVAQWYSWQRANPYPLGVNWASSLEVAFRSLSWLWMQHLLADCPVLPPSFADDLLQALALNGRRIERYLSTYFSPNTHLLGEAVALYFLGTLCPQIPAAERWKSNGWRIVQEEARRQVRSDGVYFEQSLYYHVYALDFFLHARLLAARNGAQIPTCFDEIIRKMLSLVQALSQVGPPDGFGDDDGGRLFNPRRNRAEHMTDPLVVGAAMFRDEGLAAIPTEEAIWLFGRDAIGETQDPATVNCRPKTQAFPVGGLYVLASADPIPQQLVIDAGPQGTGRSGHGHADALSVKLSFDNRRWLVDPGTFVYVTPGGERQAFRGTRAHNTLTVDGLDQANPEGPFAWSSLPVTQTEYWIPAATSALVVGSHSGYERLAEPVRHRRFVFHLHGGFWLVRDVVAGSGTHLLETYWHCAPDLEVAARGGGFVASARQDRSSPENALQLTLLPLTDPRWKSDLVVQDVSPAYGVKTPATVLRCSARVAAPAEHAMMLIPASQASGNTGRFVRASEQLAGGSGLAAYTCDTAETTHSMVFGPVKPAPWTFGPWTSDAAFLYVGVRDQRVSHLACFQASFVRLNGETVFSGDIPLQYLEWTNLRGKRRAVSSDEAAMRSFSEAPLAAVIFV